MAECWYVYVRAAIKTFIQEVKHSDRWMIGNTSATGGLTVLDLMLLGPQVASPKMWRSVEGHRRSANACYLLARSWTRPDVPWSFDAEQKAISTTSKLRTAQHHGQTCQLCGERLARLLTANENEARWRKKTSKRIRQLLRSHLAHSSCLWNNCTRVKVRSGGHCKASHPLPRN